MAALRDHIHRLCGWTHDEINNLVHNRTCPDHWYDDPRPTVALMETIRNAVDESDKLSYREDFYSIIKCMGLKEPKMHLAGLLAKIKRRIASAVKQGDFMIMCEEMTDLTWNHKELVGPNCDLIGITPNWLKQGTPLANDVQITNSIISELYQYRRRSNILWKIVASDWWPKLFPGLRIPSHCTIKSSWEAVDRKRQRFNRDSLTEENYIFLKKEYIQPAKKTINPPDTAPSVNNDPENQDISVCSDDGYDSASSESSVSPYILRRHGDTITILHELLEQEKKEKAVLENELKKSEEKCSNAERRAEDAESARDAGQAALRKLEKEHKKTVTKYSRELNKAVELSEKLQKEISSLKKTNVVRRLATCQSQLEKKEQNVAELQEEVEVLNELVKELRRTRKNRTEQVRYNVNKVSQIEEKLENENAVLKEKLEHLERENDELRSQLDEIMGEKQIQTFENGTYSTDIRVVCYELLARGVGTNHVSEIIQLVLKRVAGLDCGKLPKPTCIRYMAFEQALLSKYVAKEAISESSAAVTLLTDGTTKKHTPYVAMLASTDAGTYGLGLSEVDRENSETLLEETIEAMQQLLAIESLSSSQDVASRLLLKVKNTMTDRCVVNKKFIELLEEWREKMLPQVISDWDKINESVREQMTTINDLYCGKHVVLNLQEYAAAALNDWEAVESNGGKLGREKHMPWNRKESATFLCIRSVCAAFGPDSNEQAGCPVEFNDYLDELGLKNHLIAFRGNRFNVPFVNGAAVYYHHCNGHIDAVYDILPPHKQKNQLMRCVKYDLQDKIVVGGVRAMGIINSHITVPLMRMIDSQEVSIMQTDRYYTRLHECIKTWMENPQPLLKDTSVMFDDFAPVKDVVHNALYNPVDEEVQFLTEQAISIILHNLYVCVTRQLEDHLPGGKFHGADERLIRETQTCPKDNVAAERMFAGLDYLKRKSPNISTLAMQGILLWSLNKTSNFLKCNEEKRSKLVQQAMKNRKRVVKLYQEKKKTIKQNRLAAKTARLKEKEAKELAHVSQAISTTEHVMKTCGFICKSQDDVNRLGKLHEKNEKAKREAILSQLRYYKCINKGAVKGSLFYVTSGGKEINTCQLTENLREILKQLHVHANQVDEPGDESTNTSKNKVDSN